jgi:two-component system, OmpR family, response regulator MtrA
MAVEPSSSGAPARHDDRSGVRMGHVRVRLLTVEDDERIRTSLRMALEDEGWAVDEAATGEGALEVFARHAPELVLVDLMLPGMSGFDVVREIRRISDVPIVIVTARSDSHDVVAGLEAGADDYVRKPFAVKELSARIRAHLRRTDGVPSPRADSNVLVLGDLELRPDAGTVTRHGEEIALTKTEFRLLCELAHNEGIVLSREQLLESVWGYDYFGDARLVDAHVRRLRTKIESHPSEPDLIVTVRGLGYKLQS